MPFGCTAKDVVLHIIGIIGTAGGTSHAIEFAGSAIRALSVEGRMTVCNMAIGPAPGRGWWRWTTRPSNTSAAVLRAQWRAVGPGRQYWRTLHTDEGAKFDTVVGLTRATSSRRSPGAPRPRWCCRWIPACRIPTAKGRRAPQRHGARAGIHGPEAQHPDRYPRGPRVHRFLHQLRIEDLRAPRRCRARQRVASNVRQAMVVPGSGLVKQQAEREGWTRSSSRPASGSASPAVRCAWPRTPTGWSRASAAPPRPTATSKAARARAAARTWSARHGRRRRRGRPLRRRRSFR